LKKKHTPETLMKSEGKENSILATHSVRRDLRDPPLYNFKMDLFLKRMDSHRFKKDSNRVVS